MFKVHNRATNEVFDVFDVQKATIGDYTSFLIFNKGWKWVSAKDYVPGYPIDEYPQIKKWY